MADDGYQIVSMEELNLSKNRIHDILSRMSDEYSDGLVQESDKYQLTFTKGEKSVLLQWPYEVGEIFLYFYIDGEIVYQDWIELLAEEDISELGDYASVIINNYLQYRTQIKRKCFIFRVTQLQYFNQGAWKNIFGIEE